MLQNTRTVRGYKFEHLMNYSAINALNFKMLGGILKFKDYCKGNFKETECRK